jgi:protein SCO1/2
MAVEKASKEGRTMKDMSRRTMLGMLGMAPFAGGLITAAGATHPVATTKLTLSEQARRRIQAQHLPNLPLITHEGKHVRFYDDLIKDKIVSLNFFFANCDEVCPLVMANLSKVQTLLGGQVGRDIFMYSFTLKPEEDTLDVIQRHREIYHAKPGWTFLTAKPEDMEKLRKAIGFTYPEPAIDKDKTQHIGNIRYGNEPLMLWSACPGMAHAKWIAETLEWAIHPETNRVQAS